VRSVERLVSERRTLEQRTANVREALSRNGDMYLATATPSGEPHLIAVSSWWDGNRIVVATLGTSRTARNLDAGRLARLALGPPADMIVIDASVVDTVDVDVADLRMGDGFATAVGWNPADEGPGWRFFRFSPVQIQAYRGYGELPGRDVMREGR
jgi:hypothetical protein